MLPVSGTIEEIRARLARVPEYDLEGLWAVGLEAPSKDHIDAYGLYDRWRLQGRRPIIALYSYQHPWEYRIPRRYRSRRIAQAYRVALSFGMEVDYQGSRPTLRWSEECLRRYMLEHTLLHEIGHHVQFQQRWRAGYCRWLPGSVKEQFAEDYAIRATRRRYRAPVTWPFACRK
jgi:hypothetical protein